MSQVFLPENGELFELRGFRDVLNVPFEIPPCHRKHDAIINELSIVNINKISKNKLAKCECHIINP